MDMVTEGMGDAIDNALEEDAKEGERVACKPCTWWDWHWHQ